MPLLCEIVNILKIYEATFVHHWLSSSRHLCLGCLALSPPILNRLRHIRYIPFHSARVIVAQQQSLVALVQGIDVQCYNYSLPYSFTSPPNVAVGNT